MAPNATVSTTTIWVQRIFVAAICAFQCNGTIRKQGFPLRDKTRCHPIAKSAATAHKDRGRGGGGSNGYNLRALKSDIVLGNFRARLASVICCLGRSLRATSLCPDDPPFDLSPIGMIPRAAPHTNVGAHFYEIAASQFV